MNDFPSHVKEKLNSLIKDMSEHHWIFSTHPGRDFSRQSVGKLSFYDTMRLIIGMGKGSTNDEIMDFFEMDPELSLQMKPPKRTANAYESLTTNIFTSWTSHPP